MEKVLKKANIKPECNIITAVTDVKKMSGKRVENFIWGVILLLLGLTFIGLAIYSIGSILTASLSWGSVIGLFFLFILCLLAALFFIAISVFAIKAESQWFFILYNDHILYKYREETSDKKFKELKVPNKDIQKCYILRKRLDRLTYIKLKKVVIIEYHISIPLC